MIATIMEQSNINVLVKYKERFCPTKVLLYDLNLTYKLLMCMLLSRLYSYKQLVQSILPLLLFIWRRQPLFVIVQGILRRI